jgi:hypothetical protein
VTKRIENVHLAHLYKVSDVLSGKFYVGKHGGTTQGNYWGSGLRLCRHIKKYGKDKMKYEILVIGTQQYIFDIEKQYVTDEFINNNKNCLNICSGGIGGNLGGVPHNKGKTTPTEVKAKQSLAKIGKPSPRKGAVLSEEAKQKISFANKGFKHSQETKEKMSAFKFGMKYRKVECPHCHTVGGAATMPRWHFDNCRNKESI